MTSELPKQSMLRVLQQRNLLGLLRFAAVLLGLITLFSAVFQLLMAYEGQQHSWVTGFYWTLSTMSTLGYGDVSFVSDPGRLFSIFVLLSGVIFMLVLLPFTFMELFYAPWVEMRAANRIPRKVDDDLSGHVIMTFYGPVASALIAKLKQFNYPYVVILPDSVEVMQLIDHGINAIHGELNLPETYLNARVEQASLVATTRTDVANTSIVFTVRGITKTTPVIATARDSDSKDVLRLAGTTRVLDLTHLMSESLARRAIGGNELIHVIGNIDDLLIAEVDASKTNLVGIDYTTAQRQTSVSLVGFWDRGSFQVGEQDSKIEPNTLLVLAGSKIQLDEFNRLYCHETQTNEYKPVIIIGGGRVGRATARALARRGIDYRIVEQLPERVPDSEKYIVGTAADRNILRQAGIDQAPTVIITTKDDEINTYLTIFSRLLRPDIQIICRASLESSVAGLHRAGSDIVMSYASMGSNALFNLLQRSDLLMIAEGLDVFKVEVPEQLVGRTLAEADIKQLTTCSVIGIDRDKKTITNPEPDTLLQANEEIVLIGTPEGERKFLKLFASKKPLATNGQTQQ
ncbi:MAG: potassium channel family protein [bacterium]